MSIIVPSNHTRKGAWVNSKMSGRNPLVSILYNSINRQARTSHKHRRHGELGLQLSLLHYIYHRRIEWVSMKGIYRYRCRHDPGKIPRRL